MIVDGYKIERNDKWWGIIKEQVSTMREMAKEKKLPPPRPLKKDDYECKNCDLRTICHKSKPWKDPNLEIKRENFYKELL